MGLTTQMQNAAFSERKGQPHCDWGTKALHNHHMRNLFQQFLSCKTLHCITQNWLFENFICCVIIAGSMICFHFLQFFSGSDKSEKAKNGEVLAHDLGIFWELGESSRDFWETQGNSKKFRGFCGAIDMNSVAILGCRTHLGFGAVGGVWGLTSEMSWQCEKRSQQRTGVWATPGPRKTTVKMVILRVQIDTEYDRAKVPQHNGHDPAFFSGSLKAFCFHPY